MVTNESGLRPCFQRYVLTQLLDVTIITEVRSSCILMLGSCLGYGQEAPVMNYRKSMHS